MNMYKDVVDICGKKKTVVVINYKKDSGKQSKTVDSLHHIQLLDRSLSMSCDIRDLIEHVKKTIDLMSDNDYVSIIWFSGAGQFKTLIKGAKKDKGLYTLLDSIKSCVGTTCFSESLKEAGEIIKDLKEICPNYNVTLFTDGCPVVPWSDEELRSFGEVDKWKDDVLALNTVGYGNYYNQNFLRDLSGKTNFGVMMHSRNIAEYSSIWQANFDRVSELVVESVSVESQKADIMYLSSNTVSLSADAMEMNALSKNKNQFVIIGDGDFDFSINGFRYSVDGINPKIGKSTLETVLYGYAYSLYYLGHRQIALDVLANNLQDKYFVDKQMFAYTFDEISEYNGQLKKAVFKKGKRLLGGKCDEGYLPSPDALCVMDILRLLTNGDNYYVYSSEYKRIGLKTEDSFNLFTKSEREVATPVSELVLNKQELNVSIRNLIKGEVRLNPVRAKKVDLPEIIGASMSRNQAIIKDGCLNMDKITVIPDAKTLSILKDIAGDHICVKGNGYVDIFLSNLPTINRVYVENTDTCGVLDLTKKILLQEAKQATLNYLIKTHSTEEFKAGMTNYTMEQLEVLKEHGLDARLQYSGVKLEKAEKGEDFYEARTLKFQIKGSATAPSLEKVLVKVNGGKKLKDTEQFMFDYMLDALKIKDYEVDLDLVVKPDCLSSLCDRLDNVKKNLKELRFDAFLIKMSKILTGDWFPGVEQDKNGNYVYEQDGDTLVIKSEKIKKYY